MARGPRGTARGRPGADVAAGVALIATGIVHGYWSDRWASDQQVTDAVARLADIPMHIGEWEGKEILHLLMSEEGVTEEGVVVDIGVEEEGQLVLEVVEEAAIPF